MNHPRFAFLHHDPIFYLDAQVNGFHKLVCPATPVGHQRDPFQTANANARGAKSLLEMTKRLSAKNMQASTSEIFGVPAQHLQQSAGRGTVNPMDLWVCDGEGMCCAQMLYFDCERQIGVLNKGVGSFNSDDTGLQPCNGRVVPKSVVEVLWSVPHPLYCCDSFCHFNDTTEEFIRLMDSPDDSWGLVNPDNRPEFSLVCSMTDLRQQMCAETAWT